MARLIPVAAALLVGGSAPAQEGAAFEEAPQARSIALGPTPSGEATASFDLGWLRSGARIDIGLDYGVDLQFSADAFLLHGGLSGQDALHAALRWTPLDAGTLRLSVAGGVGEVFAQQRFGSISSFEVRGELLVGYSLEEVGLPYARLAGRTLRSSEFDFSTWDRDLEAGLGYELPLGRVMLGAEVFAWSREHASTLAQWRLRIGVPL